MQIGQNIQLLASSTYGEYYDAPATSSRAYGVTGTGSLGKITKLNVAGVGDINKFTEFEKNGQKYYVKNGDFGTDFEAFDAPITGNSGGEPKPTTQSGGGLLDTLGKFFDFAKTIFEINNITIDLKPIPTSAFPTPAQRPLYSVLDKSKIKTTFGLYIATWEESLKNTPKLQQ